MSLSRLQIIVVKTMGKEISLLQKKLDRIEAKEQAFLASIAEEKEALIEGIAKINKNVVDYTGGLTLNEVLAPESTVIAPVEGAVIDETALAPEEDMTEALRELTGEQYAGITDENTVGTTEISSEDLGLESGVEENLVIEQLSSESEAEASASVEAKPDTVPFWDTVAAK